MLRRSHNEVINIFMNKINHALTLRHSTSESQMWPHQPPFLHRRTSEASWAQGKHPAIRNLGIFMRGCVNNSYLNLRQGKEKLQKYHHRQPAHITTRLKKATGNFFLFFSSPLANPWSTPAFSMLGYACGLVWTWVPECSRR